MVVTDRQTDRPTRQIDGQHSEPIGVAGVFPFEYGRYPKNNLIRLYPHRIKDII